MLSCRRCGREIVRNAALAVDVFEGMHWLCFHLEYEHDGDPDVVCGDVSCPWFQIAALRSSLEQRGIDPDSELKLAIERHWQKGESSNDA